jgi:hypothetical protein
MSPKSAQRFWDNDMLKTKLKRIALSAMRFSQRA